MPLEWYVIRSKPNKEMFLVGQLESRDVEVFYPKLHVKPVNPRSRKIRPYFPGYLFIHVDMEKNASVIFERIPGVMHLVHVGGEVARVPEAVVLGIKARVDEIKTAGGEILETLKPGDRVKIDRGPFEGYEGILDVRISGTERVRVLLQMLQKRQLPVELPAAYVEKKK